MNAHWIQEQLSRSFDSAFGVDDVMKAVPELVPESVATATLAPIEAPEVERFVRAAARPPATTSPPLDLIRTYRKQRRRRIAASVGVCVLLAAAVAQWRWGGKNSRETLDYEKAFHVLFDDSYDVERQRSAQGKIFIVIQNAVRALKAERDGSTLGDASRQSISAIAGLIADPVPADPELLSRLPALEQLTDELMAGDGTPQTISQMTSLVQAGIYALDRVRTRGPGEHLYSDEFLSKLAREVAR